MGRKDTYLEPYREALLQHGSAFEVTLWASERTQVIRFEVFRQMVYFAGKRVLDAGCSRGDFAAFLLDHGLEYEHFVGVDGLPEVIDYARSRDLLRTNFVTGDFVANGKLLKTDQPQIIAISGTLNTMDYATATRLLDNAWKAASETLIFNFLSDRCGPSAPPQAYPAKRLPTTKLIDWALERTWDVTFRQDYFKHGHDGTILMRKH